MNVIEQTKKFERKSVGRIIGYLTALSVFGGKFFVPTAYNQQKCVLLCFYGTIRHGVQPSLRFTLAYFRSMDATDFFAGQLSIRACHARSGTICLSASLVFVSTLWQGPKKKKKTRQQNLLRTKYKRLNSHPSIYKVCASRLHISIRIESTQYLSLHIADQSR